MDHSGGFLEEGKNSNIPGEIVYLEKLITMFMGNCYKVSSVLTNMYTIKDMTYILLHFNTSIAKDDLPSVNVYLTSENNAYGILFNRWVNGNVVRNHIKNGMVKETELKQEKISLLAKNSKCTDETYFGCISRHLAAELNGSSSNCGIFSFPGLPVCNIRKTDEEMNEFFDIAKKAVIQCPDKLCNTVEYSSSEIYYEEFTSIMSGNRGSAGLYKNQNITMGFRYKFSPHNSTTIYEEYLVYDSISMIGSVGGTLGMCIGFSFTGLISPLINLLQQLMEFIKKKLTKQKKFKSNQIQSNHLMKINRIYKKDSLNMDDFEKIRNVVRMECLHILEGYSNLEKKEALKTLELQ